METHEGGGGWSDRVEEKEGCLQINIMKKTIKVRNQKVKDKKTLKINWKIKDEKKNKCM